MAVDPYARYKTRKSLGTIDARRKKREENERNRNYAEEIRKKAQSDKKKADQKKNDSKNVFQKAGDAAGAVGNFVKDAAIDVKDKASDAFTGTKDTIQGQAASQKQSKATEEAMKVTKEWSAYQSKLKESDYDKPEVKAKNAEYSRRIKEVQGKVTDKDRKELDEAQKVDAKKTAAGAAETALNVGTLGLGTGVKQLAKQGVKKGSKAVFDSAAKGGAKKFAKEAAKDAPIGAAYGLTHTAYSDPDATISDYAKNAALGAGIGAAAPVAIKGAAKAIKGSDKAAGRAVQNILAKEGEEASPRLTNIGEKGVVGSLNDMMSKTGRKAVYKASDAMDSTKAGSKVIDMKDRFMTAWVTENHALYKVLKRSDFEGKTEGAYVAAREAIGNSNRALSYAQDFMENNENIARVTAGIENKSKKAGISDLVEGRKNFDEYAKVRADLDLVAAGKKEFSEKKMAELNARKEKLGVDFDEEYQGLVGFYKDLNDLRLKEGLISKQQYDEFAEEGFDYVRVQRELPDWMLDKPASKGRGSTASITKSDAVQKRNKYASAEQLSPTETLIKTAQLAHVEAMRNKAAKTVTSLLEEAGEGKVLRTTDIVREKQALLKDLKASKPIISKMNKVLRSNKKALARLEREINELKGQGRKELTKELKSKTKEIDARVTNPEIPMNPKAVLEELMSVDSVALRKIRRMLESRDAKLEPILDKVEILNRDVADAYAKRKGLWDQAQGMKTSVDKKGKNTMSFLDDGVENIVEISPEVASAVHSWDKQHQNVLMDVMRFSNNVFKYGTTGANAGFALPNFVADQVGSAINSRAVMSTHNPRNFVHSFMMTIGKPMGPEDRKILDGYLRANQGQTSINQYTKKAGADKTANKLVGKDARWTSKTYTMVKHPKEAWRALFDATEGGVALTEKLTRVQNYRGGYKKAVKEGMEDDAERIANQQARENSVDFLEMGSYGRVINSLVPYFNAAIQGNRIMLRNASERPASFAAKTATLVGVPIMATTAWNTIDSDRKAIYDTIPEYIKETNYIVIGPGAKWNDETRKWDGVVMMKKPPGFKEFAEPIRKYAEYVANNDPEKASGLWGFIGEEGGGVAADFGQTFSPIDFSDENKFLSSVTPQILKPTAEAILNKNFFQGEDIVKDYMQDQAPEDQKYQNYSQLTTHIGAMFNTSPLKVDHWIRATFGEVGTNAQHYTDRHVLGADEEAVGGRSLPESVTRRFKSPSGGADTDLFYKTYNPASSARKRASKEITAMVKEGRINEAKRKAESYNESINDRFKDFMKAQGDSPTYDSKWDERINELFIPTTEQAFKARKRQ